jgi:hypothetical protein
LMQTICTTIAALKSYLHCDSFVASSGSRGDK